MTDDGKGRDPLTRMLMLLGLSLVIWGVIVFFTVTAYFAVVR